MAKKTQTTTMQDPEPTDGTVADRARRVVLAADVNQRRFAELIGMDPTALSKALRGTRRLQDHELAAIARVGKVPVRYLTTGSGREPIAVTRAAGSRRRAETLDTDTRRIQILEATARLIARHGIHAVRVADIARACGTSTGTVHYHFPAKDGALRAALLFYADRLHDRLEREFQQVGDTMEMLRRLVEVQLPSSSDDIDEWSVWIQSWTAAMLEPSLREGQRAVYSRWRGIVLDLVRRCQREGLAPDADPEALASRFTGLVDGLAIQMLSGSAEMPVERMRELLLDAFEPHITLRRPGGE
ncbi:TetR family transcriptional regulator C-terminal domain-containing protein [Streptacidiphilus sp. PAMC 29251]